MTFDEFMKMLDVLIKVKSMGFNVRSLKTQFVNRLSRSDLEYADKLELMAWLREI